jgi:hypothetical protein
MMRRTLLPCIFLLLLTGFYLFEGQPSSLYRLGTFGLPAVFASPALTKDTTHLPAVRFIVAGPALSPQVEEYLLKGIHFMYKFYITQFDYAFPQDMNIVIRVFGNYDAYKAYTGHVTTSPINKHIGLYVYKTRK